MAVRDLDITVAMSPHESPNPYVGQLVEALSLEAVHVVPLSWRSALAVDLVHLHWSIDTLTARGARPRRALRLLAQLALVRARRRPVVWTVHNLSGHEASTTGWADLARAGHLRLITGWVSLTAAAVPLAKAALPRLATVPHVVSPHGLYPLPTDCGTGPEGPRPTDVLHLGRMRPYKGTLDLIKVLRATPELSLTVAGEVPPEVPEHGAALREALAGLPRSRALLRRLTEAEVCVLLNDAALVVLPYEDTSLNSGTALWAISHGCPVLLPASATYRELERRFGPDRVQLHEGPLDPPVLRAAVERARSVPRGTRPHDSGWAETARAHRQLYDQLLAGNEDRPVA